MEKEMNDTRINANGSLNVQQIFFVQRYMELLNTNTHSSYSIHFLNTHEAIKELIYVTNAVINDDIHGQHLQSVIKETRELLERDIIFRKNAEPLFRMLKNTLSQNFQSSSSSKLYSLLYQLNNIHTQIKSEYLNWIINEIDALFQVRTTKEQDNNALFAKINDQMKSLISELLGRGWSIHGLYVIILNAVKQRKISDHFWNDFFSCIKDDTKPYVCLFPMVDQASESFYKMSERMQLDMLSGTEILNTYSIKGISHHISSRTMYLRQITNVYDTYTAVNSSWQMIMRTYDVFRFYGVKAPLLNRIPIVISPNADKFSRKIEVELVINTNKAEAPTSLIESACKRMDSNKPSGITERIRSLFEFSRISDESLSVQSAYINLWIALESFVQTKEYSGDIETVQKVVSAAELDSYIYGLIRNFYEDCRRCHVDFTKVGISLKREWTLKRKVMLILSAFIDDVANKKLISECKKCNTLLGLRASCLISCFHNGKDVAKLMEKHREHVSSHLLRLYRARNAIVHTATTEYNISLFIKHLREYINVTLSVVLHRLEINQDESLEQTLSCIKDFNEATIDVLKNSHELDSDSYLSLLLDGAF